MITMKMRLFIKLSVFRLFSSYSSTRAERERERGHIFHPTYIYMRVSQCCCSAIREHCRTETHLHWDSDIGPDATTLANLIQIGS